MDVPSLGVGVGVQTSEGRPTRQRIDLGTCPAKEKAPREGEEQVFRQRMGRKFCRISFLTGSTVRVVFGRHNPVRT